MGYKNTVLRPFREGDLADVQRWFTTETEWGRWDAPWEEFGDIDEFLAGKREYLQKITSKPPDVYFSLEIETDAGRHIGWVSRYDMLDDENLIALGLDIPPQDARGRGYGKNAFKLWIAYNFKHSDADEIYTQTWSGNYPMLGLAESIGFKEIGRIRGVRRVRGERYDALTFSIAREEFFQAYPELEDVVI
jgi:RimJ/RimL family protein N-acetyltransferase